jgi:GTP-binding protein
VKFIDESIITVTSGSGGHGCVSFRRERYVERGGPDGGNGGNGGSVILVTSSRAKTLYEFQYKKHITAKNGSGGHGSQKHGKNGESVTLELPYGTVVTNADTGELIHDFISPDECFVLLKGGRGGKGNKHFATSRNRAPKFAQDGEKGEVLRIKLELKLLAEIGIVGYPNAGKSTLISVISSARPKTASYPFTTITPNIGMVQHGWGEPFAVADIPGLIDGAHKGTGLGIQFLRHVERTKILIHLIDASDIDPEDPLKQYTAINNELRLYSEKLVQKKQIVVLNKTDIPGTTEKIKIFREKLPDTDVLTISAITQNGTKKLVETMANALSESYED